LDNLTLIAVFIIVLWLAAIGYYIYLSRQQRELADEIQKLRDLVGMGKGEGESD
jgi:preprotein translocase subunit YajC